MTTRRNKKLRTKKKRNFRRKQNKKSMKGGICTGCPMFDSTFGLNCNTTENGIKYAKKSSQNLVLERDKKDTKNALVKDLTNEVEELEKQLNNNISLPLQEKNEVLTKILNKLDIIRIECKYFCLSKKYDEMNATYAKYLPQLTNVWSEQRKIDKQKKIDEEQKKIDERHKVIQQAINKSRIQLTAIKEAADKKLEEEAEEKEAEKLEKEEEKLEKEAEKEEKLEKEAEKERIKENGLVDQSVGNVRQKVNTIEGNVRKQQNKDYQNNNVVVNSVGYYGGKSSRKPRGGKIIRRKSAKTRKSAKSAKSAKTRKSAKSAKTLRKRSRKNRRR